MQLTLMLKDLVANDPTPSAVVSWLASWKESSLHWSEASTYTRRKKIFKCLEHEHNILNQRDSLCSPVLTPQRTGGALPPGFVTENRSAMHWPEVVEANPLVFF